MSIFVFLRDDRGGFGFARGRVTVNALKYARSALTMREKLLPVAAAVFSGKHAPFDHELEWFDVPPVWDDAEVIILQHPIQTVPLPSRPPPNPPLPSREWITTFSRRKFWPLNPRVADIELVDIAHHLSMICRFTGACRSFYSVAQHSVLVSRYTEAALFDASQKGDTTPGKRLLSWALLHDAAEAYLMDIATPVKYAPPLAHYRVIEKLIQAAVCDRFGLDREEPPFVKAIDTRMLRTEQRDLMPPPFDDEPRPEEPFLETVVPWSAAKAEHEFLIRCNELQLR